MGTRKRIGALSWLRDVVILNGERHTIQGREAMKGGRRCVTLVKPDGTLVALNGHVNTLVETEPK